MRLLLISHVLPFPGNAGQQQRVRYTLEAAVREFEVDFLTCVPEEQRANVGERLAGFGCRPIMLPSRLAKGSFSKLRFALDAWLFALSTGLKRSNYLIGRVELSPSRIRSAVRPSDYQVLLYEYFHAVDSVEQFQDAGVPTVVDTHNLLWKSLEQHMPGKRFLPTAVKRAWVSRYRAQEERAWQRFDGVIAINRHEHDMIKECLQPAQRLFYAPMGTDLSHWPACWQPANPPRLAYYGGLGSAHNEAAALQCHDQIMPTIWQRFPTAELWLVGSGPSDRLRSLTSDPRVKVTGFVEKVQDVLSTMSLVLCPWSGTYGFRSRLVEVMALGVPVVATPAAVDGMELESGRGIILDDTDKAMASHAVALLENKADLEKQSHLARAEMERLYSLDNTYGRLTTELRTWLETRSQGRTAR